MVIMDMMEEKVQIKEVKPQKVPEEEAVDMVKEVKGRGYDGGYGDGYGGE